MPKTNPLDALKQIEGHLEEGNTFEARTANGYQCKVSAVPGEDGVYVVVIREADGSLMQTSGAAGLENLLQVMTQYAPREQWLAPE